MKTGPFGNQALFDHSNIGLVRYMNGNCTLKVGCLNIPLDQPLEFKKVHLSAAIYYYHNISNYVHDKLMCALSLTPFSL